MARVPSYAPGAPSGRGTFLRLAHPAPVAARLVADAVGTAEAAPAEGPPPLRRRFVLGLLALLVAALALDAVQGYGRSTFTRVLFPLVAIGIPLGLAVTRPPGTGLMATIRAKLAPRFGRFFALAILTLFAGSMLGIALAAPWTHWLRLGGIVVFLFFVFGLAGGPPADARPAGAVRARLEAARVVLLALADDVAPGKAVTGWVDLTGAEQKSKLFARGTASSGAKVEVFRDEWLHLSAPLRDGTRIRVAAVERRKVKLARWVSRGGKTKRKPRTVAQTLATVEVRARIDPRRYRPKPPAAPGTRLGRVTVSALDATADTISGVFVPAEDSRPEDILDAVAHVFGHLERLPPPVQP
jgi:hypothetical protein